MVASLSILFRQGGYKLHGKPVLGIIRPEVIDKITFNYGYVSVKIKYNNTGTYRWYYTKIKIIKISLKKMKLIIKE